MAKPLLKHRVVLAALASNVLIAAAKFVAAGLSGSAVMASEGVHSLVDSANELLLLYGKHRAGLPPDRRHPLGRGRELYFWSFVVALLVLTLGAGVSLYEGIGQIRSPAPLVDSPISYFVLGLSALFEGTSWFFAWREFRQGKGRLSYFQAFRQSKDPTTFTVLFEDSTALVGLLVAFLGVFGAHALDEPRLDGAASIVIALLLAVAAALLLRETKALLIGESADSRLSDAIRSIAEGTAGIRQVNGLLTMQLGPDQVLVALSAEFEDGLTTPHIEQCISCVEQRARKAKLPIVGIFIKPQTPAMWQARLRAIDEAGLEDA